MEIKNFFGIILIIILLIFIFKKKNTKEGLINHSDDKELLINQLLGFPTDWNGSVEYTYGNIPKKMSIINENESNLNDILNEKSLVIWKTHRNQLKDLIKEKTKKEEEFLNIFYEHNKKEYCRLIGLNKECKLKSPNYNTCILINNDIQNECKIDELTEREKNEINSFKKNNNLNIYIKNTIIEKAVKELEIFKIEIRRSKIAPTKYDHCPIDNIYTSKNKEICNYREEETEEWINNELNIIDKLNEKEDPSISEIMETLNYILDKARIMIQTIIDYQKSYGEIKYTKILSKLNRSHQLKRIFEKRIEQKEKEIAELLTDENNYTEEWISNNPNYFSEGVPEKKEDCKPDNCCSINPNKIQQNNDTVCGYGGSWIIPIVGSKRCNEINLDTENYNNCRLGPCSCTFEDKSCGCNPFKIDDRIIKWLKIENKGVKWIRKWSRKKTYWKWMKVTKDIWINNYPGSEKYYTFNNPMNKNQEWIEVYKKIGENDGKIFGNFIFFVNTRTGETKKEPLWGKVTSSIKDEDISNIKKYNLPYGTYWWNYKTNNQWSTSSVNLGGGEVEINKWSQTENKYIPSKFNTNELF